MEETSQRGIVRRAPHGARGLKHSAKDELLMELESRPARGAWIETPHRPYPKRDGGVAPRTGRVD